MLDLRHRASIMGISSSSSRRNRAAANKEGFFDSESSLSSSNGEWDDLPARPADGTVAEETHYDYLLKLTFVGDSCAGKSCLLMQYVEDSFNPTYTETIAIDFKITKITIDERKFKLQLWDTAGNERFRTITTAYYRGSKGIFLVYDAQNEASFDKLYKWVCHIKENAPPHVHLTLLANKCDLKKEEHDQEDYLQTKKFAEANGMAFFEVSAKDGTNVELAMTNMVARIWRTIIKQKTLSND